MTYNISGLHNIAVKTQNSTSLRLEVVHTGGHKEEVDLSVIDLPPNVAAKLQPATGVPPFETLITISSKDTTTGKFLAKLIARQATGLEKSFGLTLSVHRICVGHMAGSYTTQSFYGTGESEVTIVAAELNKIHVTNLYHLSHCDVIVNCKDRTLTIPRTTDNNGYVIYGEGKITDDNEFVLSHVVEENKYDVYSGLTTFKRK